MIMKVLLEVDDESQQNDEEIVEIVNAQVPEGIVAEKI